MKIYEGTDGLRGLVRKLIEVYNFKKVVYEGDNTSIDTKDATFQLWVTDELFLRGQFTDTAAHGWCDLRTEALTCPCVSITNYTSDKRRWIIYKQSDLVAIGIDNNTASRPNINIIIGEITNYETGETEIGMTTVVSTSQNKGFTNVYHILSHIQGISDSNTYCDYAVPTQTILLNNKKYLLSRFAFEIKE